MKPLVVAIAAISGGGKTTVTRQLTRQISNTRSLHFDDYKFKGEPENFYDWTINGADYDIWNVETLVNDLKLMINNNYNLSYIFIDYAFAYLNKQMKELINVAIFIDTPLDIAMARRVIRDFENEPCVKIINDFKYYLKYGRISYLKMLETVKPNSDIIINGCQSVGETVKEIIKCLQLIPLS